MGIPLFYNKWIKNNPKIHAVIKELPKQIGSIYIDANSMLHTVCAMVYAQGDFKDEVRQKGIENDWKTLPDFTTRMDIILENNLKKEIMRILNIYKPKDLLYFAIDGVAPQAKISQQRFRRFDETKANDAVSTDGIFRVTDSIKNYGAGGLIFDTTCITPGTDFMIKVDNMLKKILQETKVTRHIIYSSHMEPGEGEHKIMAALRSDWIGQFINVEENHVILGLDADLIILSSLCPIKNLYLLREDTKYGKYPDVMDINTFRNDINNMGISLEDFSIIISMFGSDFLPHQAIIEDVESINTLIDFLQKLKVHLADANHNIIKENFTLFMQTIYANEKIMYTLLYNKLQKDSRAVPNYLLNKNITSTNTVSGSRGCLQFDMENYRNMYYKKQFGENSVVVLQDIINFAKEYLNAIQWINQYYHFGHYKVNNGWYYPYFYTPMFVDIYYYLTLYDLPTNFKEINEHPTVYQQLLSVLPFKSKKLAPLELQYLFDKSGPIADLYPDSYLLDMNGKYNDYTSTKLLPQADYTRMKKLTGHLCELCKYQTVNSYIF